MKKIFWLIPIVFLLGSFSVTDGLKTILTSKEDALVNKRYKAFVMMDTKTGLCLGKQVAQFNLGEAMPTHYFTLDLSNELTQGKGVL